MVVVVTWVVGLIVWLYFTVASAIVIGMGGIVLFEEKDDNGNQLLGFPKLWGVRLC